LLQNESEELILRNKQAVEAAEQARKLEIEAGERQRVKLADRTAASLPSVEEALKKARDAAKL
jgi:hypothetical protein